MMAKHRILYRKQKESFWERYKLKIASTLFAILVWFLIITGGTFEYVTTIPIKPPVTQQDYIITNDIPDNATIRLRGQGTVLLAYLIFREGRLFLDFNWSLGVQTVNTSKQNILLTGNAKNLTVLELIEPETIRLQVEELIQKTLPVKPGFTLHTRPGYTIVGDIQLSPPRVTIQGPKSLVDSCQFVETREYTWKDVKFPINKEIDLKRPSHPKLELLQQQVTVHANVQKLMEKTIERIDVQVINLPQNADALVIPSTVSLVVEGGVNVVTQITASDIRATIDYRASQKTGNKDFPVTIEPIPEVRFRDINPKRFKVVLDRSDSTSP
jgi:YbbR domain-containing protein